MKYLIIGIYDTGYEFSVCDNGTTFFKGDDQADEVYAKYLDAFNDKLFHDWLIDRYPDYDLIVVCENGDTQVLVDSSK